jgi:hypothetical protein
MATQAEKIEKLAEIQGTRTYYELAIVKGDERYLYCYSADKGRQPLIRCVVDNLKRAELTVRFTGSENFTIPRDKNAKMTVGDWTIEWTGRTQRQAISEGELTFFGNSEKTS